MDTQVGIVEDFLNKELALHLKTNLLNLYKQNLLYQAGTGSSATLKTNSAFRNDRIFWLDKNNKNHYEAHFFMLIENFIRYLNSSCYTGITDYEFHYTLYKPGAFYKKHIDQFKDNHQRTFSMISYLNADWQQAHGGELILHRPTC